MGQGEVCLEIGPSIVGVGLVLPGFAIVQEHAGFKEDLKGGGDNLGGGIWSISGSEGAFDLAIGIVGGLEGDVIVLEVGCGDASVLGV